MNKRSFYDQLSYSIISTSSCIEDCSACLHHLAMAVSFTGRRQRSVWLLIPQIRPRSKHKVWLRYVVRTFLVFLLSSYSIGPGFGRVVAALTSSHYFDFFLKTTVFYQCNKRETVAYFRHRLEDVNKQH